MTREFFQECCEILASELPFEGLGHCLEADFKLAEPVGDRGKRREIVWRERFSLDDGEVDFDLVQPTGMHRAVDQSQIFVAALKSGDGALAAVTAAVVDNPEDTAGAAVGFLAHDLFDQPVKGRDPAFVFAAAENLGAMHVPGGQIGPGSVPLVFVLDLHRLMRCRRQCRVNSRAGLDAGLFVCGDNEIVDSERATLPLSLVQVQEPASFDLKIGIAGKDPAAMLPRTNRILVQPAPQRAVADARHQTTITNVSSQFRHAPTSQWFLVLRGQFAGQGLNLYDQLRGEKTGGGPVEAFLPSQKAVR